MGESFVLPPGQLTFFLSPSSSSSSSCLSFSRKKREEETQRRRRRERKWRGGGKGGEGRFLLPGIRDFNEGGKGEKGGQRRRLSDLLDRFNYGIFPCTTKTSSKKIGIAGGTLLHTHRKQKRLFCSAIVLHLVKHPPSLFFSPSRLLLFSRI